MAEREASTPRAGDPTCTYPAERNAIARGTMLTRPETARQFILAGSAVFTAVSAKTSTRFTFKVSQPSPTSPHFVGVLSGPDNLDDYTYLGTVFDGATYRHGRKSSISPTAPSAKAFAWVWEHIARGVLPPSCELVGAGRCGKCARLLSVPGSVAAGYGPDCLASLGR